MKRKRPKTNPNALLASVAQRVELPAMPVSIRYDEEADTLYLKFRDDLPANRTTDDLEAGLIYDYHDRTLVGIEVLMAAGNDGKSAVARSASGRSEGRA